MMIVRLETGGAVVSDADDCTRLHLETTLDTAALRTALRTTGTGDVHVERPGEAGRQG